MNARKEQARITPLTQPAFAKKERKEERKMYERYNFTSIILEGESENTETIPEANMTAGLL